MKRQSQLNQQQYPTAYQSPYRSSYPPKMDSPASHNQPQSSEIILTPQNLIPSLPKTSPPYRGFSSPPPQKPSVSPPQSSPRLKSDKKSVSFNETVDTNEPSSHLGLDRVREDPNVSNLEINITLFIFSS